MKLLLIKSLFRRKKNIYFYILAFMLLFILFYTLLNFKNSITEKLNSNIIEKIENRQIFVTAKNNNYSKKDIAEILSSETTIESIHDYFLPIITSKTEYGYISINKYTGDELDLVLGRFPNNDARDEIIIPRLFNIGGKLIETIDLINTEIEISIVINHQQVYKKFLIVGIYNLDNSSIISNFYSSNLSFQIDNSESNFIVTLKSSKNIKRVVEYLNSKEFVASLYNDKTHEEFIVYTKFQRIINIFIYITLFLNIMLVHLIIGNFISLQNRNIAIMKVYGYNSIKLIKNAIVCILLIINLTYILFLIALSIGCFISKFIFSNNIFNACNSIKLFVFINVITLIVIFLHYKKIRKISIIKLLHLDLS